MLTKIVSGLKEHIEKYVLYFPPVFPSEPGCRFRCDRNGQLLPMLPCSRGEWRYLQDHQGFFGTPVVEDHSYTYEYPSEGTCECGRIVELAPAAETHCGCGARYDSEGQEILWVRFDH